jgi:poly-gamma-glutamate synthesis protein (capsule biosynthesis protein)
MNFVGDVCLQGLNPHAFVIDEQVKTLFERANLSVANLEAPLTRSTRTAPGLPWNLKGDPEPSPVLELFDIFSLSNNHVLDYGQEGLEETLAFLSSQKKRWFGAGLNRTQAWKPLCIHQDGFKVAFLGCTRSNNATAKTGGTTPMNIRRLARIIRSLKEHKWFVVVCPHWNYEYVDYPSPIGRKQGKHLVDAGADLVVGGHPHHVQGVEIYRGRHIFHSLGNFIFPLFDLTRPEFSQTFILTVILNQNMTYTVQTTPVAATVHGLFPMSPVDADVFHQKLEKVSKAFDHNGDCKRLFYRNAGRILSANMRVLEAGSTHKSAYLTILKRLHRITRQDIYIKLHSLISHFAGEQ